MVREVITLNVGQAGVQLGQTIWEQYNMEHSIDLNGHKTNMEDDSSFHTFYHYNIEKRQYEARNLMIDLEPEAIDNIKTSKFAKLFNSKYSLSHKDGADGIFARGHYTVGKELEDKVNNSLRLIVEDCDNVQGFIMNHSVGGGTGSGLGTLILERIAVEYVKKNKFSYNIHPFDNNYSNNYVEPYNALLTTHWLLDYTEASFLFDNHKLHNIYKDKLLINRPSYNDMNNLIAKMASPSTYPLRFDRETFDVDMNDIVSFFVPFPRFHFIMTSIAPLINIEGVMKNNRYLVDGFVRKHCHTPLYQDVMDMIYAVYDINCKEDDLSVLQVAENAVNPEYFSIDIPDFDAADRERNAYNALWLMFSGDIEAKEANHTAQYLKTNSKVTFDGWAPTGFRIDLNKRPPPMLPNDVVATTKRNAAMIGSNVCMGRFFDQRILRDYDKMYSQRAFVHWYCGEGMEEGQLSEARENVGFLVQDYLDAMCEQAADEETESD